GANFNQPNTPVARLLNGNRNHNSLKANSYIAKPSSENSEQTRFPAVGQ
ncbi:hypothetical protein A2U01_0117753, partial [Trifolium medium]|nr:hypothetical protein [Trifolium medium]